MAMKGGGAILISGIGSADLGEASGKMFYSFFEACRLRDAISVPLEKVAAS